MEKSLLKVKLNVEPVTWGSEKDAQRRDEIREAIRKKIPGFDEHYIEHLIKECEELLGCLVEFTFKRDITDNNDCA